MAVPLQRSTRLGPYEIVALLGAGGMGEVYRARDTRLNRDVAIKLLPEVLAGDPDRVARFHREAQVLASLNHPNIAQIHGLEEHAAGGSGVHAVVMELVEGEDLARRLQRGALPLEDALRIAKQIAEGLEAAHEQGIVHRDLKPANVQMRPDGTVKLLDFGIAKALDPPPPGASGMNTPTVTAQQSALGLVIGTPAYMAPEQASGRAVDRRADIWAFGAVLYEMLTGRLAFPGDHATDSIAAILGGEPQWDALPAPTPARVRTLLRRCLTRDPKQRLQAIGDARIEIDDLLARTGPQEAAAAPHARSRALAVAAAVLVLAVVGLAAALLLTNGSGAAHEPSRMSLLLPPGDVLAPSIHGSQVAISPDGRTIVYAAVRGGTTHLFRRAIDQLKPVQMNGTAGAGNPFFSPDGAWVAFGADGRLKKMRLDGTAEPIVICEAATVGGADWGADDTILFGAIRVGLQRVRAAGGDPEPMTTQGPEDFRHGLPQFLPGGRHVLFHIDRGSTDVVAAVSLADRAVTHLFEATGVRYSPTGHLVFTRPDGLWAVGFDAASLRSIGEPVKLQDRPQVDSAGGVAHYAFGPGETLVYLPQPAPPLERPVWLSAGKPPEPLPIDERPYTDIALAPAGDRLAFATPGDSDVPEIWVRDLRRRTSIPVAAERGQASSMPVWSRDGTRIAFSRWQVNRFNLFVTAADGTGRSEQLNDRRTLKLPQFWTQDDTALVFAEVPLDAVRMNADLAILSLKDRKERPLLRTEHSEVNAVLSPDGRYMAYQSNDSGRWEVYVRPFPDVDRARWPVSPDAGEDPRWSADGAWLFYRSGGRIMRVAVHTKGAFGVDPPQLVVDTGLASTTGQSPAAYVFRRRSYDVAPDSRVLALQEDAFAARDRAPREIVVVSNWVSQLSRR